jgi:tRNA pseudouridine55 synthase
VIDPRARPPRSAIDGVLLLDKPPGLTSQTAVTRVKALLNALKAGHTGTLDPMATGLLPIALGEATKFSGALLDATKSYVATVRLGQTTTTGDLEGEVTRTAPVHTTRADIEAALQQFRGEIVQTPPMYSALKHAGKPLYRYAREGVEIERAPRRVTIGELALDVYAEGEARVTVSCSKGTYIRVLAEDVGAALGCGACLAALRRTRVGHLDIADAIALEALAALPAAERKARLLPVDAMLAELPMLELDQGRADRIVLGMSVECAAGMAPGLTRIYAPGHAFLGVALADPAGRLQPRRLVASKGVNLEKSGV